MSIEHDLRKTDMDILKGLNHTLVKAEPKQEPKEPKRTEVPPDVRIPETKVVEQKAEPTVVTKSRVKTENAVLQRLRETFGIEKIKRVDITLNDMTFTLKPVSAAWLSWADSYALISVVDENGNYNRLEYEGNFKIFFAAACVEKIDGMNVWEVFEARTEREGRAKLAEFFLKENDSLANKIFTEYDEQVEPAVSVQEKERETTKTTYQCTACGNIAILERRNETYYCNLDGEKLIEYKLEDNLPLP